ncbi:MAG: secondary thiamine-phosphate synthase enzyme YjbQ [bacterium]|nr:secondary thiamine-phosphate synthase enzyme YjbQ [bacterium]
MKSSNKTLHLKSKTNNEFINLTDDIIKFVRDSAMQNGLLNIQLLHTSAGLIINECDEPLLAKDIAHHLEQLAPKDRGYHHDNFEIRTVHMFEDEGVNGHSHCKAILLPSSITLNLINGVLQLGTYQKIFFIELDEARDRKVQLHLIGE